MKDEGRNSKIKSGSNKACSGRVGFCGIFKHFSGFEFFLPQAESTPAHTQVTQAVIDMIKIGTSGFSFPDWVGNVYPTDIKKGEMLQYYEQNLGFKLFNI